MRWRTCKSPRRYSSYVHRRHAPKGVCGSGILAAVKELLRTGIVKKTGVFVKKEALGEEDYRQHLIRLNGTKREFVLDEKRDLFITQGDVRQVRSLPKERFCPDLWHC